MHARRQLRPLPRQPTHGLPAGTRVAAIGCTCWLAIAAGCSHATEPPVAAQSSSGAEQTPATAPAAPAPVDLAYHMRSSFWDAVEARDALIKGDLARAQHYADALAQRDYAALVSPDWKHWVAQLQQHAKELSIAPNIGAAAQELGRMALVCGDCHDLHERGPSHPRMKPLPFEDPPDSYDARMHRHQLGMAQMWDGLVLPSEKAWQSGTVTITRAPLRAPEREGESVDAATAARIEEIRALAKQARSADSYDARGQVYAELIARCASFHASERPIRD
jgi:hypothetical protein